MFIKAQDIDNHVNYINTNKIHYIRKMGERLIFKMDDNYVIKVRVDKINVSKLKDLLDLKVITE